MDYMCFFTLLYKLCDDYPVVVAANRDEFLDRAGTEPFEIRPGVWAGQDRRSGGTWLGVNRRGMVAAVTNIYGAGAIHAQARSRGLLCLDALELPSAASLEAFMRQQARQHTFNDFNLVLADAGNAFAAAMIDGELNLTTLPPGAHVLANTHVDNMADPKVRRGFAVIEAEGIVTHGAARTGQAVDASGRPACSLPIDAVMEKLARVCRDHGSGAGDAICVHAHDSGTLSSSLIAIHKDSLARSRYLFCNSPPCETEYRSVSEFGLKNCNDNDSPRRTRRTQR
jgi:uncharacterized protein with NRDE domain